MYLKNITTVKKDIVNAVKYDILMVHVKIVTLIVINKNIDI